MRSFVTDVMGFDRVPRQAERGNVVPLGQQRRDGLVVGVALSPQLLIDPNEENASFLDPRQDLRMSRQIGLRFHGSASIPQGCRRSCRERPPNRIPLAPRVQVPILLVLRAPRHSAPGVPQVSFVGASSPRCQRKGRRGVA